jgi:hypothetical protein
MSMVVKSPRINVQAMSRCDPPNINGTRSRQMSEL